MENLTLSGCADCWKQAEYAACARGIAYLLCSDCLDERELSEVFETVKRMRWAVARKEE